MSLAVAAQNLVALFADLGPVRLKATQDREIAIVHHGAAIARDVRRTCFLFFCCATALLILSEGSRCGCCKQDSDKQRFKHCNPWSGRAFDCEDYRSASSECQSQVFHIATWSPYFIGVWRQCTDCGALAQCRHISIRFVHAGTRRFQNFPITRCSLEDSSARAGSAAPAAEQG